MGKLGLSWQQHPFLPVNKHKQKVRKILRGRERLGVMIIESGDTRENETNWLSKAQKLSVLL